MGDGHQKEQQWTEVAVDDAVDIHDDRSTGSWAMESAMNAVAGYELKRQYSSGDVALETGCSTSEAVSNSRGSPF